MCQQAELSKKQNQVGLTSLAGQSRHLGDSLRKEAVDAKQQETVEYPWGEQVCIHQ